MLRKSFKTGISFGLTTGVITTLGIIIGLNASTHSKIAVLGGILSVAIVDAAADSLGVHISEEAEGKNSKGIWEATLSTFVSKFLFTASFIVPVLLMRLPVAIAVDLAWGMILLGTLSYFIAKQNQEKVVKVVAEHLSIAIAAIVIIHYVGTWISKTFI